MVFAEGDDALRPLGKFAMPSDLVTLETRAPQLACDPVPTDIGAGEVLEPLAVVDVTASDRGRFGVGKIECRRQNRCGAALCFRPHLLPAFHNGPAIVAAALHAVDHFP